MTWKALSFVETIENSIDTVGRLHMLYLALGVNLNIRSFFYFLFIAILPICQSFVFPIFTLFLYIYTQRIQIRS